jgi:D-alanine-D-alanine ligase
MLDLLQVPYTHSGMKASAVGMDKHLTKFIAKTCGIKVAQSQKMTVEEFLKKGTEVNLPYVVKPVSEGSSVGVFIVEKIDDISKISYENTGREILIEKYIPGHELTVMCLDNKAYVVTELKSSNNFYDYNAKYTSGKTEHILPAKIPSDVEYLCKCYAEKLHKALGCNTVSRVDFRWNEVDGVVLLEINTNPGMTALSLVPEQAKYVGISYADLCAKLVDGAKCRGMVD